MFYGFMRVPIRALEMLNSCHNKLFNTFVI